MRTEFGDFIDQIRSEAGQRPLPVGTVATMSRGSREFDGIEKGAGGWAQLTGADLVTRFGSKTDARAIHREIVRTTPQPSRR